MGKKLKRVIGFYSLVQMDINMMMLSAGVNLIALTQILERNLKKEHYFSGTIVLIQVIIKVRMLFYENSY